MRVLVTGATGFIGGHLVRTLSHQGHCVRALVRQDAPALADLDVELARGDVDDAAAVRTAVDGTEAVVHLAAARDAWGTPASVYRSVNVKGTETLLIAAAEVGVERFVHCSSVGVARYPGNREADEMLPFRRPTSQVLYHRTKMEAERMAMAWAAAGRLPVVVVRPVITYGPRDERGFVTRLIELLGRGQFFWVGSGENHVDLVYIDDLIAGLYRALERGVAGRVYILSGMAPIRVGSLVDQICRLVGQSRPRLYVPASFARLVGWGLETIYRAGARWGMGMDGREPFITRDKVATLTVDRGFSHARARRELGYAPAIGYGEGLRRTLDWLRCSGRLEEDAGSG
jgi:nucleoside-diphosphate-sugar epimerase